MIRKLAFDAWLEFTENTGRHLRTLRRWQAESREAAAQRVEARLADTLLHAYRHNAWYRQRLGAVGAVRDDAVRLDAFRNIPVLEREELRRHFDGLACDDRIEGTFEINRSSGSTGEQVRFLQDRDYGDWRRAVQIQAESWAGYWYGMPKILLWGSPQDLALGHETVRLRIGRWLRNETCLSAFDMTSASMTEYLDRIDAVKPFAIHGYADCVFELARQAKRLRRQPHRPRAVMTTAVTLYDHMRTTIAEVFGPVFNQYGAREVGLIAAETANHDGLMAIGACNHVEILRPDGTPCDPSEPGDVVVTNLTNRTMPLIRYRIGDVASWTDPRAHAKVWPVLEKVHGRSDDFIRLRDGSLIAPETIEYLLVLVLNNDDWFDQFQAHQESLEAVTVSLVLSPAGAASETLPRRIEEVAQAIGRALRGMCRVDVRIVEHIVPTASGKHRRVTSAIA